MEKHTIFKVVEGGYIIHAYKVVDEDPDLSHLGEYAATPAKVHIDRKERGDMGRNEFRYFNLGTGDADYIEEDYKRAEAYNRGEWCMMGVCVDIHVKTKTNWAVPPVVGRASVWGIESDSEPSYFDEVANDLVKEAKIDLKNLRKAIK
jgi:hypothetical protein